MLGKGGGEFASISQGSFIKSLMELITKKPDSYLIHLKEGVDLVPEDLPFNEYFRTGRDEVIQKILVNLFAAVREVFPEEWGMPDKYM